ncbi:MAG TPA: hypothetical protein VKE22_09565 [Haliangiales bacterium]|nr:hypothetical protein [Haliangiales bacterium]
MKKLGALLIALALAAAACATDDATRPLPKPGDPPTSVADLTDCRTMAAQIAGRVASIYRARDDTSMFILIVDGDPACATDLTGVNESGVHYSDTPVEAAKCPVCDGQPMPANTFPGLQ